MLPLALRAIGASSAISLSGALTTSSASSPVTSSTRTVTGNGTLLFDGVYTASGTPQYSKNGGAFTDITEGMTLAIAGGDTLAVRATLPTIANEAGFNLKNNATGALIEAVTLTKT